MMKEAVPRITLYLVLALPAFVLAPFSAKAQSVPACTVEVPVSVLTSGGDLIRGLQTDSFSALKNKKPFPIWSLAPDQGPRRIVVLLDRSSKMNEPARKLTGAAMARILENARPDDSFALITSGKGATRIPFGEKPATLLARLNELLGSQSRGAIPSACWTRW